VPTVATTKDGNINASHRIFSTKHVMQVGWTVSM
jgi:hypothetical protein